MLKYFQSLNLLTTEELLYLEEKYYSKNLNKGDCFTREREINHEIAWIKKGIIRTLYTTEKGDEFTYCILFENTLITALSSFISGKPTTENMQTVCNAHKKRIH